jgi:hypothetical protein
VNLASKPVAAVNRDLHAPLGPIRPLGVEVVVADPAEPDSIENLFIEKLPVVLVDGERLVEPLGGRAALLVFGVECIVLDLVQRLQRDIRPFGTR